MANEQKKLKSRLAALNGSLDELQEKLEPLLAQTLPESVVALETLQQAKLQVALPYLVYDLIFIYLKTKGIDPKTHRVVGELDRIRQYFEKIKNAEDPAKRKSAVDKAAATRFIKHAITQIETNDAQPSQAGPSHIRFTDKDSKPAASASIPVRVTSKMKARARYEQELKEMGSEEEEDLQMFDHTEDHDKAADTDIPSGAEDDTETKSGHPSKRRRPQLDPFGGYGSDHESAARSSKRGKVTLEEAASPAGAASSAPGTSEEVGEPSASKGKKKVKKSKKKEIQKES
ncbi:hypothetical protein GLOTRDRAFT_118629 [Gloeophyllum trabeum ATCC 11539]|uniref:Exosome complex protein n=1 Tax=Gloeophyllum trabeum (strain ATCC 11539 / FP-39264 / Madison 617) TaxID=670483 RepID=S7QLM8_GLOTA|nr:uncharacterized protein GLOTRDRAFT_118629 [Gloeophyllum trabeum ATCC 11539]EPQ60312.1 hypothetical protein GLOTRDRAFT_118629 [Gloeophyllum trabeum ATCC 11539]